ncbi:MAG: VanW family protein [Patescibacteria group bacterium]
MPGVMLGNMSVGGFSPEYAVDILEQYKEKLRTEGAHFSYRGKTATLYPRLIPLGSDIPLEAMTVLYDLDVDTTVNELLLVGRRGSFFQQQRDRFTALIYGATIVPITILNKEAIVKELQREFSFFHTPPVDAAFVLDEKGALIIVKERSGIEFDYTAAMDVLRDQSIALQVPTVNLVENPIQPHITENDLEDLRPTIQEVAERMPLTLSVKGNERTWTVPAATIISWIAPRKDDGRIAISYDQQKIISYLDENVAPDVYVEAVPPRFEMKNGRVTAFAIAKNGQQMDSAASAEALRETLFDETTTALLAIAIVEPPFSTGTDGVPQILHLLGRSETDFSGSPQNRRKNIMRGTELINGILLAPEETFSTIKALGTIDGENGFLPELVIKGDRTIPEFGGGLCQVSTTIFRAVSYAGLEVLERHSHSYRVSYYEPPVGFDATIYDPSPDLKFKNDTKNHVLVQARIEGNKIIVDLWGTKDGRKVEIDEPTVYNIKKPIAPKIVETDTLPPGEKKRIERAHNGADAVFERRITYADGTIKKEAYRSHYVAWPEVWLVGREKVTESEDPIPTE